LEIKECVNLNSRKSSKRREIWEMTKCSGLDGTESEENVATLLAASPSPLETSLAVYKMIGFFLLLVALV
jgi:hypothetical protein